MMQNSNISTIIISNSQIEILVSYSTSTDVNVNMSFPNSKFEETLVIMCLASHIEIIGSLKLNVGHCDTYYAKKY